MKTSNTVFSPAMRLVGCVATAAGALVLSGCALFKPNSDPEATIKPVLLEDFQLDIKRQIGVFLGMQRRDAEELVAQKEDADDMYECGTGRNVFILTSVKLDVLTSIENNLNADGTGNALGGFITIPKPTGSKDSKTTQHLIYTQTILPEFAQEKTLYS